MIKKIGIVLLAIALAGFTGCSSDASALEQGGGGDVGKKPRRRQAPEAAAPVSSAAASASGVAQLVPDVLPEEPNPELVGEMTPIRSVQLGTKVPGRLKFVPLFVGDAASAGAEIASLEKREYELAVEQAEATMAGTEARLKLMEVGARPQEKQQAVEQMKQAQANMDNAKSDLRRLVDLFAKGAVSKSSLDEAETRVKVTEAQYMSSKQQHEIVLQGSRAEEREAMRAQLRQQNAALELAKMQLDYAVLRAPFDGVVAARHADEGAYVTNTSPVYTFVQLDPIFAVVDCPERYLPQMKAGLKATFRVDALPGKSFTGTLERIPVTVDSRSRTARAEFSLANPSLELRPGMFVRATLLLAK
ncbi:MAG TPA: efflux RND transporter periplasmic adaptor subunit [Candidatus Ozemobacteraceae bacterium]|nr:efflux RND transporter periplasmic adaptor subunit [Candidatus Ozemobacteraceae bacterium]